MIQHDYTLVNIVLEPWFLSSNTGVLNIFTSRPKGEMSPGTQTYKYCIMNCHNIYIDKLLMKNATNHELKNNEKCINLMTKVHHSHNPMCWSVCYVHIRICTINFKKLGHRSTKSIHLVTQFSSWSGVCGQAYKVHRTTERKSKSW